jgi:Tol biopolymer transport system component/DNA-binding winged helix-turn-helix (wHTH) protein
MSEEGKYFYEFGRFRLDPVKRRLTRDGEPVRLTPKAFDTLLILVESSNRTLEKDDLMQMVWPDAAVEENNLNQNISALRRVLGDTRDESRYIATIPGLGYRFVAEVNRVPLARAAEPLTEPRKLRLVVGGAIEPDEDELNPEQDSRPISPEAASPLTGTARERDSPERIEPLTSPALRAAEPAVAAPARHPRVMTLVLGLIVIGAAAFALWVFKLVEPNRFEAPATEPAGNRIEVTILTRTGTVGSAAISRDGRHIVYSVREPGRESLWLRQVEAPSAQQIIPPAEVTYQALTFSPDGNHVYLVRGEMNGLVRTLYRTPALGGIPAKLLADVHSPITLSPDGSRLAFVRDTRDQSVLMIADADGSNQRKLAARPITDYFKVPAWSPDGGQIACSAGSGAPYDINNSIIVVRVSDGTQRVVTQQKWAFTRWVEWLADGSGLLITGRDRHEAHNQIWHISYPGGAARKLTDDSKPYFSVSLTAESRALLAVQAALLSDIWVVPDWKTGEARKITFGAGSYGTVCYAPDGRIVYSSAASGTGDIWIMNGDGSNQKQLTADAGVDDDPMVSPDGQYIVFGSNRAGASNIWRMNIDGSNPLQLTSGRGEKFPQCSPDGKWVVYNSVASDQDFYAIWKVPIEGGEPTRLTDSNSHYPAISPDGLRIAYLQRDESATDRYRIVVIPSGGGQPEKTFDVAQVLELSAYIRWFPDGQSVTYAAARDGFYNIWMQPLSGGPAKQVSDFKIEGRLALDWSRDGKQLVFVRRLWTNDLVLMRNFAAKGF